MDNADFLRYAVPQARARRETEGQLNFGWGAPQRGEEPSAVAKA